MNQQQRPTSQEKPGYLTKSELVPRAVSFSITIFALVFAILHVFGLEERPLKWDTVTLGLCIAAVLPWLVDRIATLKVAGVEITQKIASQDIKIEEQQEQLRERYANCTEALLKLAIRARWRIFHWSGNQSDNSLTLTSGKFINSCVRYN